MNTYVLALLVLVGSAGISPLFANGAYGCGSCGHGMSSSPGAGNATAPDVDDYATGRRLVHFEKYAEAIPYLVRAHDERPHDADILAYLGYARHMTGDDDAALDSYQRALTEDPDHKLAHEYLGELYLGTHNPTSAQGQLAELVRLCPSSCDERDALTKAISAYRSATPAATTSAAAPPAKP
jgi:tetratricopeptide (TPR) repeat protein